VAENSTAKKNDGRTISKEQQKIHNTGKVAAQVLAKENKTIINCSTSAA
jgi:hypothetical protein